jgi:hypothetical protein
MRWCISAQSETILPCKELFFKHSLKKKQGRASKGEDGKEPDMIARHFGTAMPNDIPESTEWPAT